MKVVGLDFAAEMLQYAKKREVSGCQRQSAEIEWVEGDATDLRFQDQSFDAATMGYGLRNVCSKAPAVTKVRSKSLSHRCKYCIYLPAELIHLSV